MIYGATAVLSLVLLVGYCCLVQKKEAWFLLLFSSVLVVNLGYFCLACASNLEQALLANRLAYLGSVFLPLSMFFIILDVTNTKYGKRLPFLLFCLSAVMFIIAGSPGYLDIYYQEVSFAVVNGVSTLVKVYGTFHCLYLYFLLGYFVAMVAVILRAIIKKHIGTTSHAIILAMAVLMNIGVWLIEQLVEINFEMLSVSYIISELFLLGVHLVMHENQQLKEIVNNVGSADLLIPSDVPEFGVVPNLLNESAGSERERISTFISGLNELTQTEQHIYESYIARATTKEIMAKLNIKENTLKDHNKNLYSKLGVSSHKELLEMYKRLKVMKEKHEEVSNVSIQ